MFVRLYVNILEFKISNNFGVPREILKKITKNDGQKVKMV